MSWTDRNLAVQGYCMSAEESHALRWGLRFPTALCLGSSSPVSPFSQPS